MEDSEVSLRLRSLHGGRYEVFEEFAAGGIATVHLARYVTPGGVNKLVAIKRLHPHHVKDSEFRSALLDEARFGSRISHPNAVGVIDVIDEAGELVLVMEYVHGVSFSRLIGANGREPVDPSIACAVVAGALRGLHAAHELRGDDGKLLGLVHRDVSPQNILVGADGLARVIDFGLAHALGRASSTKSGEVKGKPSYMSPEQVRGQPLTRASDIFSAGVVLWNALTGTKLFGTDSRMESVLMKILTAKLNPPSTVVPGIPPALDAAVMRALTRAPSSRFSTAIAMANAIEAAVPPLPIGALGDWARTAGGEWLDEMSQRVRRIEIASHHPPPLTAPGAVGVTHRRSIPDAEPQSTEPPASEPVPVRREITARLLTPAPMPVPGFLVGPPPSYPQPTANPPPMPTEGARVSSSGVTPGPVSVTVPHGRRNLVAFLVAAAAFSITAALIAYAAGRTAKTSTPPVSGVTVASSSADTSHSPAHGAHAATLASTESTAQPQPQPSEAPSASASNRPTIPSRRKPKATGCVDMLDPRCQ